MNAKTACISGGTSGIGLATAEILLAKGWQVAIAAAMKPKARKPCSIFPKKAIRRLILPVMSVKMKTVNR